MLRIISAFDSNVFHGRPRSAVMPRFIPFLSHERDVEFIPLELLAWIRHHVIKGAFEQVLSPDDQPFTRQIGVYVRTGGSCLDLRQF